MNTQKEKADRTASCILNPSMKPAVCRWRLSRTEAERLAVVAGEKDMPPGEWCVRTLRHALDRAERKPVPPTSLVPRPEDRDARSFLEPMASPSFFENNPPIRAQMRELLEVWEKYRAGLLVPLF